MAVKSKKIIKQMHDVVDKIAADATEAQFLAGIAFLQSLITDSDESEEDEEDEVVEKKGKKGKGKVKEEEDEEEEEEAEEDEEESEEDEEEDEEEEDEEEEDEDEEEKTVKKKTTKKSSAKSEDEGRDYKSLNEKKIVAIFKEANVDSSVYSKIKSDKTKLLKLLKQFDSSVAEYKGKSLAKLTSIAKKQDVTPKFGRGRSNDDKKINVLANALAAAALAE